MTKPAPEFFKVTDPLCDPDMRCDSTVTVLLPYDADEPYGVDCVLEVDHADFGEGKHTDGDGMFWDEDGDIEYA